LTDTDKQNSTKNTQTKYNSKSKQHKTHQNKTAPVQTPLRHSVRKQRS